MAVASVAVIIGGACPLPDASYVLRSTGTDWLSIGPAVPDGEMILRYTKGPMTSSVPLTQMLDIGVRIERLDANHQPFPGTRNEAPNYIRISGIAERTDIPDGEYRLAACRPSKPPGK